MFYKKPYDISYTEMAIYVDNHIYSNDRDDDKIFEYLYHISHMLAVKRCLFTSAKNYDDFSIYFATETFLRLIQSIIEVRSQATAQKILIYGMIIINIFMIKIPLV